jgi:branched-chain amino acid transport system permease protein
VDFFLQQLVNGLSLGAIYGLIAIGYSMVYGTAGMINFAHGDIFMIGAFASLIAFLLLVTLGVSFIPLAIVLVLIVTVILSGFLGWLIERLAYRPLRNGSSLTLLISAIGVSIVLQNIIMLTQGADVKRLQPIVSGAFIILAAILVMGAFAYFLLATRFGRAHRATQQDRTMAALLGVDTDRTITASFVIGGGLAAVAGLMVTLYYGAVDFSMGFVAGIHALAAAILGGLGSPAGAMLGGLLIGLADAFWSGYFGMAYRDSAIFGILVVVLIFRPFGLLGHAAIEKV